MTKHQLQAFKGRLNVARTSWGILFRLIPASVILDTTAGNVVCAINDLKPFWPPAGLTVFMLHHCTHHCQICLDLSNMQIRCQPNNEWHSICTTSNAAVHGQLAASVKLCKHHGKIYMLQAQNLRNAPSTAVFTLAFCAPNRAMHNTRTGSC